MTDRVPVLIGTLGLVTGECFILSDGADLIVGRSRSCDISLRRSDGYVKATAESRDSDHEFNTVSRRHTRLQVHDAVIRVQDLSTNGTFCNDEPVQQSKEIDLNSGDVVLRLGTRESFQMTLLPKDDPRVANARRNKSPDKDKNGKVGAKSGSDEDNPFPP
jgi:pSer/pThr/pTyr-binding forkhead associated (FHA) protein